MGFEASANSVSFEQLYDGTAAQFWAEHDDEEPNAFEKTLAEALAVFDQVCFLTHSDETDGTIELSSTEGVPEKLWRLWHRRDPVRLRCASGPTDMLGLFDQTGFNWSMQWQRAFVFDKPADGFDRILALAEPKDLAKNNFEALWRDGVAAYLAPGVDGVCAALFSSRREVCNRFANALDTAVTGTGLPYRNDYENKELNA